MEILFSRAEKSEIDAVFEVFSLAIENMNKQGIWQWDELYPDKKVLAEDIDSKTLYIGKINGEIASVFVINHYCDDEYNDGKWQYKDLSYCIVHRLCVNPKFQNLGIGTDTMKYIEKFVKEMGIDTIRLDCFTKNPYAVRMYKKLDYIIVGYADWRKGRFYLMEKKIS